MPETTKKNEPLNKEALTNVNAALEALAESESVDENALETISATVEKLNENTRAAILDLPVMQALLEKVGEKAVGTAEPGSYRKAGAFDVKVPYTQEDLFKKWGTVERWVAPSKEKVITPGGWTFLINEGVVYDIPRGTPTDKVPENHGYQLPGIVISIIEDAREARRISKRETEQGSFGLGVRFLESGWAGKESVIAAGAGSAPVDDEK